VTKANVVNIDDAPVINAVTRTRIGVMTHLAPKGLSMTEGELQPLQDAVDTCLREWDIQIVIDLSTVHLLHSNALETLLDMQERLAKVGGWLKVSNVKPLVKEIFFLTGLINSIPFADEEQDPQLPLPNSFSRGKSRLGDLLVKGSVNREKGK
jgi:anti-anti-sigma factor